MISTKTDEDYISFVASLKEPATAEPVSVDALGEVVGSDDGPQLLNVLSTSCS